MPFYHWQKILKGSAYRKVKSEKCTLSKTGGRADLLIWLHKRIEEESFEGRKVPLARFSLLSVLSRMLVWGPTGQFTCLAYTFHVSMC